MTESYAVGIDCYPQAASAKAVQLLLRDIGRMWFPAALVEMERQSGAGPWTHRAYVPRDWAMHRAELVPHLARDVCGPPAYPTYDFRLKRRPADAAPETEADSVSSVLYVERGLARLSQSVLAEVLAVTPEAVEDLERSRQTFADPTALPHAVKAIRDEAARRARVWRQQTGRPFPRPLRSR